MKSVFIIDDERTIADTLAQILRHEGYESYAFYDATSAIERFDDVRPDIVITDVNMPVINGILLAIFVMQRMPECKVVLFSGQATTLSLLEEFHAKGFDFEVLPKPLHPLELIARIAA